MALSFSRRHRVRLIEVVPSWYSAMSAGSAKVWPDTDWQGNVGRDPNVADNSADGGVERNTVGILSYSGGHLNTVGLHDGATWRPGIWFGLHGGGHEGYAGNEIVSFGPLHSESPTWLRTARAHPVKNANFNGNQPASQHSYAHQIFLPSVNRLLIPVISSRFSDSGQSALTSMFDFNVADPENNLTSAWLKSPTVPNAGYPTSYGQDLYGTLGCLDRVANKAYVVGGSGYTYLTVYDVASNSWATYPEGGGKNQTISYSDKKTCAIDPASKVLLVISDNAAPVALDCRTPSGEFYTPTMSGPVPQGIGGIEWDWSDNRFAYYAGGNTIYFCTPPANPYQGGDTWVWTSQAFTGDTAPDIPVQTGIAMYNRFRHVPAPIKGFIALAGHNTDLAFFKVA